jgi:hypothetical protein
MRIFLIYILSIFILCCKCSDSDFGEFTQVFQELNINDILHQPSPDVQPIVQTLKDEKNRFIEDSVLHGSDTYENGTSPVDFNDPYYDLSYHLVLLNVQAAWFFHNKTGRGVHLLILDDGNIK